MLVRARTGPAAGPPLDPHGGGPAEPLVGPAEPLAEPLVGSLVRSPSGRIRLAVAAGFAALTVLTACTAGPSAEPGTVPTAAAPAGTVGAATVAGGTSPAESASPSPSPGGAPVAGSPTSPLPAPADPSPASSPTGTSVPVPVGFSATVSAIDDATAARMTSSWRAGCPVPLTDLRYLTLTYRGFDGADHTGELVVAASVADDVVATFRQLYQDGYPIASMRLVDDFGGDDDASMAANNTSAFNCRPVTGGGGFSEHSYGTAIDVNPVQNPYVRGTTVLPPAGRASVDRPDAPGVIHDGDPVVRAFAAHGFAWGGDWQSPIDYQHFSVSGR